MARRKTNRTATDKEQDVIDVHRAWELDAQAEAALLQIIPIMEESNAAETTRGPRQLRIRQLAKTIPEIHALHEQADALYWGIVRRHHRFLSQCARDHAIKSQVPLEATSGSTTEGAYQAALRWEPEKSAFLTYVKPYINSYWQRAPERQGVVSLGLSRSSRSGSGYGRVPDAESLDAPIQEGSDILGVDGLADPNPEGIETAERSLDLTHLLHRLQPEDRVYVQGWMREESNADFARRLGVTRQAVDNRLRAITRTLQDLMDRPIPHRIPHFIPGVSMPVKPDPAETPPASLRSPVPAAACLSGESSQSPEHPDHVKHKREQAQALQGQVGQLTLILGVLTRILPSGD